MPDDRLPVKILIDAVLKKCTEEGIVYYILQRGDPHTGTFLVKISNREGQCKLLTQMRDLDYNLKWCAALQQEILPESEADTYMAEAKKSDPDLWIFEIEDPSLQNPFDL